LPSPLIIPAVVHADSQDARAIGLNGVADGVPTIARRLFMLDCRLPESDVEARYSGLAAYLKTGRDTVGETSSVAASGSLTLGAAGYRLRFRLIYPGGVGITDAVAVGCLTVTSPSRRHSPIRFQM
jgi:hypothetical protein